jgi:hypothetical protein
MDAARRGMNRVARLHGLLVLVVALVSVAPSVVAETTTEHPASILIFPKVIFDGTRDTMIQISNTANSMVHARCFYINSAPICTGEGSCLGENTCTRDCLPQWQEVDFNIWLTKQQPTHWVASFGRLQSLADNPCGAGEYSCNFAGLNPGRVPPVTKPFTGELRCIEVDQSGAPISGNHLKGEATIVSRDGDASQYNAVGILGEPFTNDGDNTLCLGGEVTPDCPTGAEYEGCPERTYLPSFAEGADNPLFGPMSEVRTEVTVAPCRAHLELQEPTKITLQFLAVNEFEQSLSASTSVDCWRSFFLSDVSNIFTVRGTGGSRLLQTSMRPVIQSNGKFSSFVAVVEEYHTLGEGVEARAAYNVHESGEFGVVKPGDSGLNELIVLPAGP